MRRVKKMRRRSAELDQGGAKGSAAPLPEWKLYTPKVIDPKRCMARIWGDGAGGQCTRAQSRGMRFCAFHAKQEGGQGWHGAVDGEIPAEKLTEFRNKRAQEEQGAEAEGKTGGEAGATVGWWAQARRLGMSPQEMPMQTPGCLAATPLRPLCLRLLLV